jgi:hypothetical protein
MHQVHRNFAKRFDHSRLLQERRNLLRATHVPPRRVFAKNSHRVFGLALLILIEASKSTFVDLVGAAFNTQQLKLCAQLCHGGRVLPRSD